MQHQREVSKSCFWNSYVLKTISDQYKTHKVCDRAVERTLYVLNFVSDWFVAPKMLELLDNDELITWRNGNKQRKGWNKKIDKELLPYHGILLNVFQWIGVCQKLRWERRRFIVRTPLKKTLIKFCVI